ncbi:MAG: hypothetical protein E5W45_08095, partial [Mesorhizobium sp.]
MTAVVLESMLQQPVFRTEIRFPPKRRKNSVAVRFLQRNGPELATALSIGALARVVSAQRRLELELQMKGIARAALKGVKRPDLLQTRAYLKGDWLSKQQTIAVLDPATGEELAQVAACSV